jgi:O-antigen/teichoic acid export membrane protein
MLQLPLRLLRAEQKAAHYVTIDMIVFLATVLLNILFIVRFKLGVLGILESRIIATFVGMAVSLRIVTKYLTLKFSIKEIKKQLSFGVPLIVANFAFFAIRLPDRYMLKSMVGMAELGLYSVAHKFAAVFIFFVLTPFSLALGPFMFSTYKQSNAKEVFNSVMSVFIIVSCMFFLGISMFSKDVVSIMLDSKFHQSALYIPLITGGIAIGGMTNICSLGIHLKGKTNYLAIANWAAALLCLGIYYYFISLWSVLGAALAILVTRFILVGTQFMVSQKLYHVKYNYKKIISILGICLMVFYMSTTVNYSNIPASIGVKLLVYSIFPMLLFLTRIVRYSDLKSVLVPERKQ